MNEKTDAELLADLGITPEKKSEPVRTAKDARVLSGFEEIQRFVDKHGRLPAHGPDNDIFERLYAVRLDRIRAQQDHSAMLSDVDHQGILEHQDDQSDIDSMDDEALLASMGLAPIEDEQSITSLTHVRSAAQKRDAADAVADRKLCPDFESFEPLFAAMHDDLKNQRRVTKPYTREAGNSQTTLIEQGQFYVLNGVTAYVASIEDLEKTKHGYQDGRLRVIFDNGTESNLLFQSLHKLLREDSMGRYVSEPEAGPLFVREPKASQLSVDGPLVEGAETGTIYVLRSLSTQHDIAERREIIHKIGVTGGDLSKRIINASNEPTFLLADVEIVAQFKLIGIDRTKLENLLHRFFSSARLDIEIQDRFGKPVRPREWFLVPLPAIRAAIDKIQNRTLHFYRYDITQAALVKRLTKIND